MGLMRLYASLFLLVIFAAHASAADQVLHGACGNYEFHFPNYMTLSKPRSYVDGEWAWFFNYKPKNGFGNIGVTFRERLRIPPVPTHPFGLDLYSDHLYAGKVQVAPDKAELRLYFLVLPNRCGLMSVWEWDPPMDKQREREIDSSLRNDLVALQHNLWEGARE